MCYFPANNGTCFSVFTFPTHEKQARQESSGIHYTKSAVTAPLPTPNVKGVLPLLPIQANFTL